MPSWKSSISDNDTWKLARFIHKLPGGLGAPSASTPAPSSAQAANSKQDKYALKIPGGLAFSEIRGYEGWQVIAVSHNGSALAAILGNPVMINAYKAGIPGNGKPFPDGAKMAKVHWNVKKLETFSLRGGARHPARRRLDGEGQQEVRGQRRMGLWRVRL